VQGNRTVGIEEQPSQAFLDRLGKVCSAARSRSAKSA
jgi:hypothetical protein